MPSAGDVERYAYCAHNWWLAKQGEDSHDAGSRRGIREHERMGKALSEAHSSHRVARDGLRWSLWILGVAASATFLALEVLFLQADPLHYIFLATALVLLSSSVGLMVIGLDAQRREDETRRSSNLAPGDLLDSDLSPGSAGKLMHDEHTNLQGRPDYILHTEQGVVPVEVKTGKTPPKPYKSHRLQMACYLYLLECTGKTQPQYGLLTYPDGVFPIMWGDELKEELMETLDSIGRAARSGRADRDHHHVARCRGCARRAACDQKLT